MHRTLPFALLLVLLLLPGSLPAPPLQAQAISSVPPLPPVVESDGRFGLVQSIQAPDLAYQAGSRWDRIIFPWSLIQKNGPDSWEEMYFSDAAIRAQAARGVTMAGVLIYTPQWASINPAFGRPVDRPQGLHLAYNDPKNYWGQFVRKVAARHRGVVDHWMIWNEPDLFDMAIRYTWDGSYEEYFQLLKVAYLNIKEVNPQAKVILGGLAYWMDRKYDRTPYLAALYEIIRRDPDARRYDDYFDILNVHVYNAPLNSYAVPLLMRQIMDERNVKKPIWISESNAVPYADPANPLPYAPVAATLDQQASYVIQSAAMALAAGVERYAIYKALDEKPENSSELYGLIRNDTSLKPAYVAFQVAASYFSNTRSAVFTWPGIPDVPSPEQVAALLASANTRSQFIWPAQVAQVILERGPHRTTVVWNTSPDEVVHRVPATARQATLVTKYGKTDLIEARNGHYTLELPGSRHNPDRSDYSIYLIGGDPFIIDEQVAPLPTERVISRIELAWPHGGAPVNEAGRANVTAQLIMPGSAFEPVPCRYNPSKVQLWRKPNGGTPEFVGHGAKRFAQEGGVHYPVWDFNDVDVEFARHEGNSYEFFAVVDGIVTEYQSWIYGGPNAHDSTQPPIRPLRSCE